MKIPTGNGVTAACSWVLRAGVQIQMSAKGAKIEAPKALRGWGGGGVSQRGCVNIFYF